MPDVPDLLETAHETEASGDSKGAVQIYESILNHEPDHAAALHGLGALMNRCGDFGRAKELLERAVVLRPGDPVRHVDLGESYRNLGAYHHAVGSCRVTLNLFPEYPEGLTTLGLALQGAGDLRAALEQFRRASSYRPDFSPAHTNAGVVLRELGLPEEAVVSFERAVELRPDSPLTRTNLGLALLDCGRVAEALHQFREAVSLRPGSAVVHHNLGNALRILGHPDEALASYQEAVRLDPKLALPYLHIGRIFCLQDSLDDALKWTRLAAEIEPTNRHIWEELASIHEARNELSLVNACRQNGRDLSVNGDSQPTPEPWGSRRERGSLEGASAPSPTAEDPRPDDCGGPYSSRNIVAAAGTRELDTFDEELGIPWASLGGDSDPAAIKAKLGVSLLAQGHAAEALTQFQEALVLRPDAAILHHKLGNALRILSRLGEAREAYLRAIRLAPDLTLAYRWVAITLRLEGRSEDALKWHELAVELEPLNPDLWEELADLYLKRDEADSAVECRRRVVDLVPSDRVDARIALGAALQDDGRPDEALEQYEIALQAHPHSPDVHFALGGIDEELGDLSEAELELRTAIRLAARFPGAHARLATLLRGKLPDDDLAICADLLADPALDPLARARLLFALAHVLDGRGDYSQAAECLREANALTLASRRGDGVNYHPEEFQRLVERLTRSFDREFLRRAAGLGLETRRPVFVFGLPRSGTTLVEQILASHPRIYGAGERTLGRRSFDRMPAVLGLNRPPVECAGSLDECSILRLAGEHLGKLNALDLGRYDRIVDKLPDNYLYIGLLATMFPNATFIHCRRDPRDVAVSC